MKHRHLARTLAVGTLLAGIQFAAFAQGASAPAPGASTPRVDKRQEVQTKRIEQGVASGELTKREARKMQRQQAVVSKAEEKAKADGTVTKEERAKLHVLQDSASKGVARQKHDRAQAASAPASAPAKK